MKANKGEGYIDICVFLLCAVFAGSVLLEVCNCIVTHTRLMTKAEYLLDYTTYCGRTDGYGIDDLIRQFEQEGITVRVFSDSPQNTVQFGNQITVILSQELPLGIGSGTVKVPLRYECSGLSKRYWKE